MSKWSDKIVRVEGFELRCEMPQLAGNAVRMFRHRSALLVRITTAGGAVGWGETWAFPGPSSNFIRTILAPHILGADATNPRALQAQLLSQIIPDRRGQAHMAISAIDIAAWDAFGRIADVPIHVLLGGALRTTVKTYASGPLLVSGDNRFEGFPAEIERYADAGFKAVKIRIGTTADQDEWAIRTAREILGHDALLMVDMNEGSTVRDAISLAHRVSDSNLSWIEEPIPHDNLPGYTQLAQRMPVPLSGGESFYGVQSFRDSLCAGALDIIQPDIALCGGLTEAMRISALADAFDVGISPHVWGTGINFLAALQFCAVLSPRRGNIPFPLFEYDMSFNPLRDAFYNEMPATDGTLRIPTGPGLGIHIEPEKFSKYITDHWSAE